MENDKEVQLKLRFGDDLRSRLAVAGDRNGSSLNSEIVRRLEDSFAIERAQGGPATSALVQAIIADIAEIEGITGKSWSTDNMTFSAVRRAVIAAVLDRQPLLSESEDVAAPLFKDALDKAESLSIALRVQNMDPQGTTFPDLAASIANQIPNLQRDAAAAREAAEVAYQPQIEAERKGRRLYSEIRRRRAERRDFQSLRRGGAK